MVERIVNESVNRVGETRMRTVPLLILDVYRKNSIYLVFFRVLNTGLIFYYEKDDLRLVCCPKSSWNEAVMSVMVRSWEIDPKPTKNQRTRYGFSEHSL